MITGWKAKIRLRMMLSHVAGAVAVVLFLEMLYACIMFFVMHPATQAATNTFLTHFLPAAVLILLIAVPLSILLSLLTTRALIARMQRLVDATAQIAAGHYEQRIVVSNQRNIGMLELLEQQFNSIAEQLMQSVEQQRVLSEQNARLAERAHIFRDLHDGVKQQAFALTMQISAARALLDTQPEMARTHLENSEVLAHEMQQELTSLIHSSRPSTLSEKGFATALRDYIAAWSWQQHTPVQQHIEAFSTTPLLEETLLRITQEGLSNIARHSHATSVCYTLSYSQEDHTVKLVLQDNGCGFDENKLMLEPTAGIGLQSMRERIETLHGTLQIETGHDLGTRIVASCPHPASHYEGEQPSTDHFSHKAVPR
jgi:NarL family two-component system sensor histidine kinase LiaS